MKKLDLRERLKESLSKPPSQVNFSGPATVAAEPRPEATREQKKTVNAERATPKCITLFPSDLQLIERYRQKRAGEGQLLNLSEAIREMLKKVTL